MQGVIHKLCDEPSPQLTLKQKIILDQNLTIKDGGNILNFLNTDSRCMAMVVVSLISVTYQKQQI